MPRKRRPARGMGRVIARRIAELGLTPQELAAAARLHKGTIYCILDGRTASPRPSTVRALAKVLRITVGELTGVEQLDLLPEQDEDGGQHPLEVLLLEEFGRFPPSQQVEAARVAMFALVDTLLGMGRAIQADLYDQVTEPPTSSHEDGAWPARVAEPTVRTSEDQGWPTSLLREQFRRLPPAAKKPAARAAIGAMVDLRLARGSEPSPSLYRHLYAAARFTRRR